MQIPEILSKVKLIKQILTSMDIEGLERKCIGCRPIVNALVLLKDLEISLERELVDVQP